MRIKTLKKSLIFSSSLLKEIIKKFLKTKILKLKNENKQINHLCQKASFFSRGCITLSLQQINPSRPHIAVKSCQDHPKKKKKK
jgi:hypothetical protein